MDTQPLLAYNTWLSLSRETRQKLVRLFNIPRSGENVVRTASISPQGNIQGEVTSDGHSAKDLYAITVEKMQEFTGATMTDFYALFGKTVRLIEEPETEAIVDVHTDAPEIETKKRGRPAGSKNIKDGKKTA